MRRFVSWTVVAVTLSAGMSVVANPESIPQPGATDGRVPAKEYESYALRYKSGFAKMETRAGDYAVTIEKGVRKGSGSNNTMKTKLSFTTSTTAGGVATAAVQRETSLTADDSRVCSSFSEGILDSLLEEATGASLCRDDPTYRRARTVITAAISLAGRPEAGWQLDAVALPVVDDFGSRSVWGQGMVTSGERMLVLTYRSDSPWTEEQCLQMRQAGDERKWDCYRKVVEIEDDGELLAWFDSHDDTYTFRVGLDGDLKLALLAAIEAFRKGNSGDKGYY